MNEAVRPLSVNDCWLTLYYFYKYLVHSSEVLTLYDTFSPPPLQFVINNFGQFLLITKTQ